MRKDLPPILIVIALVGVLSLALILVRQNQNINKKASQPNGLAALVLSPAANPVMVGSSSQATLSAFTAGLAIDGLQVVVNVSGEIPSNFTFTSSPISGMQLVTNVTQNTPTGKTFEIAFITIDPLQPLIASVPIQIGTFSYTPGISGTMNISFDPVLSKIVQNQTTNDILNTPVSTDINFVLPSPTPTSMPISTSTPVPDSTSPTVLITSPINGALIPKNTTVSITASASDNIGVARVQFFVSGTLKCTATTLDPTGLYYCSWKLLGKRGANYTLQAKAYDAAGNIGTSPSVTVTAK